jgi:hypothetical protein
MSITVYVPRDAGALSLGAEACISCQGLLPPLRLAKRRDIDIRIVRNEGSRGLVLAGANGRLVEMYPWTRGLRSGVKS